MRPNVADEWTVSLSHLPKSPFMGTESAAVAATAENVAANESKSTNAVDSTSISTHISISGASFDPYRMHRYHYNVQAERLRFLQNYGTSIASGFLCPTFAATAAAAAAVTAAAAATSGGGGGGGSGGMPYGPRWAFPISLFQNRLNADEPKPQYSYIGLIAMAILSSPETKLVLSDIYQYILDNYPYFRSRGPGWRNSIRHNLSLNDCFIKAGRSANGKGHYWAIHPANIDDFKKGDFRRRKAQRKVRKHMGLAVDDDGNDSPSPPPITPPPPPAHQPSQPSSGLWQASPPFMFPAAFATASTTTASAIGIGIGISRKRQFDVASLLAPDDHASATKRRQRRLMVTSGPPPLPLPLPPPPPPYHSLEPPLLAQDVQLHSSSSGDEEDALADVDVVAGADLSNPASPNSVDIMASPTSPSGCGAATLTSATAAAAAAATGSHPFIPSSPWCIGAAVSTAAASASSLSSLDQQEFFANQVRAIHFYQQFQRRLYALDVDDTPIIEELENNG